MIPQKGTRNQFVVSQYVFGMEWGGNVGMDVLGIVSESEYSPNRDDRLLLLFNRYRVALVGFDDAGQARTAYESLKALGVPECEGCGEIRLFEDAEYSYDCRVYLGRDATAGDIHNVCVALRNLAPYCGMGMEVRDDFNRHGFLEGENVRITVSATSHEFIMHLSRTVEDILGDIVARVEVSATDGCDGETVAYDGNFVLFGMVSAVKDRDWKMNLRRLIIDLSNILYTHNV